LNETQLLTAANTSHVISKNQGWMATEKGSAFTTFELGLLLLLLLLGVFSFVCFLADPVTTSNIVGMLFIMLKSRFLHKNNQGS